MSRLRKENRDKRLQELVRAESKTNKLTLLLLDVIFLLVPFVFTLPVIVRWFLWFLCWTAFVLLVQVHFGIPKKIPLRLLITLGLSGIFLVSFYSLARGQWCEEKSALPEGNLIGAGGTHYSNLATPWVQIGDSETKFIMAPQATIQPYFKPFPDAEFLVEGGSKGPLISTTVRDRLGNLVVEIKRSHWRVYPPYCSDKNYSKYAFEAKDSSGHVLLQIRLVPPMWIQVQGEWWNNEGKGIRILKSKDGVHGEVIPLGSQNQHNDELIQPIFKYPSKEHWGEFEKN